MKVFVIGLALGCGVGPVMAGEDQPPPQAAAAAVNSEQEESPVFFEPEGDFFLGYRWVSTEDSLKAAEYIYPHSSVTFGLNLLSAPLPYRFHANGEFFSKHDFYSDVGFAYKDLFLFRDILVGVHHNLDHYKFDFDDEPSTNKIHNDENPADDYKIDFVSNLMFLRLKPTDFPFHTFLNYRHIEQDGKIEQRFLLGYFDQFEKVSESRNIEWKSNAVKLGANSHFGPVEVEYAYDHTKFKPGSNNILYDIYPPYDDPDTPGIDRPEDTYPHNVIPKTEASAHTMKMHSSYTGGIVSAATFSNLSQKNNYSQTESTTWRGAFDLSWIPDPVVSFFFKYRHKDVDMDTPDTFTLNGLSNGSVNNYMVRQGISYDKDVISLSSRYKPMQRLSLFARYEFSQIERRDDAEWHLLTPKTKIHSIDLKAQARPHDKVTLGAIYEYKNYDQPAYNTTPDKSNKLKLTTSYTPSPSLNLYLEYILFVTERDPLRYLNGEDLLETGGRDGRGDQILASLSTAISPKASLTFSWFYQRWDVEQDLVYGKWPGTGDPPYFMDTDVPYTDEANSFSLSLHWIPREDITVAADLVHTITEGTARHHDVTGVAPYSLSSFSDLETSETSFSLDMAKKLPKNWEAGLRLYYDIFNDEPAGLLDGNVFTTTFNMKRYF